MLANGTKSDQGCRGQRAQEERFGMDAEGVAAAPRIARGSGRMEREWRESRGRVEGEERSCR